MVLNAKVSLASEGFPSLPFGLTILKDPDLSPFDSNASIEGPQPPLYVPRFRLVALRFNRSGITRAFIVTIAVIPLILGILLCTLLFAANSSHPMVPDGLAGVAAVLLAILPIRFVLVPPEVSELTLVDYWLGLVMAMLAAILPGGVPCVRMEESRPVKALRPLSRDHCGLFRMLGLTEP